jgi:molybdopterin converting factor small subunit
MIRVKTKIFSQAIPDYSEIGLEDGSSVETLLNRIREGIALEFSAAGPQKIAFLNNPSGLVVLLNGVSIYTLSGWKTKLRDGDEISLLPMFAGG